MSRHWKGRRVLVTGAGGFIGSHLVERLVREGARVTAFVHYNSRSDWGNLEFCTPEVKRALRVVAGELTDPRSVFEAMEDQQTVFHLGALIAIPYSYSAPASYVSVNVQGTVNVLEAARRLEVERVVHTSTSETYGTARYVPMDEEHPLQGQSPYSASKIGADKIAESYHLSFGLPVATVRPFNAYGPRQSARAIIPTILTQMLTGRARLRLGSLKPIRDFTYVEDTVDGFLRAAQAARAVGTVVNLGSGKGVSIGELVKRAAKVCGAKVELVEDKQRVRPGASEVMRLVCDNRKALRVLGWKPRVTLDDGLHRVKRYLDANLGRYKTDRYIV
ncbi:MAG: GDP-mannose 4,6-dehydratase [Candidatus Eisenbacteria bacterium]|nr:GDP-mannose 4,6-dehydratase [Candidatus Eisenbacteria bacterium]